MFDFDAHPTLLAGYKTAALVLTIVGVLINFYLFQFTIRHKNNAAIKNRSFASLMISHFSFATAILAMCIVSLGNFSCGSYMVPVFFGLFTYGMLVFERLFLAYAFFVITTMVKANHRESVNFEANSPPTPSFSEVPDSFAGQAKQSRSGMIKKAIFENRHLITESFFSRSKLVCYAGSLFGTIAVILLTLFYRENESIMDATTIFNSPFYSSTCQLQIFYWWTRFFWPVVLLGMIFMFWVSGAIKSVQENFGIIREFRNMALTATPCLVLAILWLAVSPVGEEGGFVGFHIFFFMSYSLLALGSIYVYRISVLFNNKTTHSRASRQSFGQHELRQLEGREFLLKFLEQDELFQQFEKFLCLEFSVENAYFYRAVQAMESLCATNSYREDRKLQKRAALRLYARYCSKQSKFQINISSERKIKIDQLYSKLQNKVEDAHVEGELIDSMLTELKEAKAEVFELMLQDSFIRFKHSKEYRDWKKQTTETI
jgi:hypothetical protein